MGGAPVISPVPVDLYRLLEDPGRPVELAQTEEFFETIWGLARGGKTNEKGVPNLLQVAVIAREYADEFRLGSPPWPVQRVLFAVLAPIGRLLGSKARYPEYGG